MKSLAEVTEAIQNLNIIRNIFPDDGQFPNNGLLPVIIYQKALHFQEGNPEQTAKEIFESNGWINSWVDGIYDVHHYHSTAHEALCIIAGTARVQLGGPQGVAFIFEPGDVIVIPAGVAHQCLDADENFLCVGAYPDGQTYDILYGKDGERPQADENIKQVMLPGADPVYGVDGPLIKNWRSEQDQQQLTQTL